MTSRLGRNDSEPESGTRSSRAGLSDYTTQKLAELRARRAELDSDYTEFKSSLKPRAESISTSSLTSATTTPSSSDLLESYRSRRGLSSSTSLTSTSPTSLKSPTTNGTTTNGVSAPTTKPSTSLTAAKPAPVSSKPTLSAKPPILTTDTTTSVRSSVVNSAPKLSNGHANNTVNKTVNGAPTLSSAASFSKADYVSSRSNALDQIKASSSLSRSCSARLPSSTGLDQDDDECVGFASLPEQVHRKAVKRGFDFTLMVVGETGLGKSTLISSLFLNTELYKDREVTSVQERISKTVRVEMNYMEIEEKGVKLRLSIVDTPGFNDSMDAEQSWRPIEDYINSQFDQYFKDETGLNRKNIKDHRVHCCLYFISPYGHGLRQIDIQFMKRLHDKVNIVPIIAKADTLTPPEIRRLKDKVLEEVERHRIQIYEFPDCDSDEDDDFKKQDSELKASIPFAVIGSNTVVEVNGRKVRGRLYPWGVVEVDNPQHCDFSKLRMMLISTHMQDLKDVTRDIHYENFRARHIKEQMTKNQRERNKQTEPDEFYKVNLDKYNQDSKLKRDSSPNFENIINQDDLLEQKDEEIRMMQAQIMEMQAQLKKKGPSNGPVPIVGLGNL